MEKSDKVTGQGSVSDETEKDREQQLKSTTSKFSMSSPAFLEDNE